MAAGRLAGAAGRGGAPVGRGAGAGEVCVGRVVCKGGAEAAGETGAESAAAAGRVVSPVAVGAVGVFGAGTTFFVPALADAGAPGSGIDMVATIGTAPNGTGD